MKEHYSEADLLETYYTRPGESMPVMMHLADCEACARRYELLEKKLRSLAEPACDRPDTFWARQRLSIARRIDGERRNRASFARISRIAAAAVFILVAGGLLTWRQSSEPAAPPIQVATVAPAPVVTSEEVTTTTTATADPWQSDELNDFQSIVDWESWVDHGSNQGEQPL